MNSFLKREIKAQSGSYFEKNPVGRPGRDFKCRYAVQKYRYTVENPGRLSKMPFGQQRFPAGRIQVRRKSTMK
jgi:hypothetical protein